jgi:hypothetical protein
VLFPGRPFQPSLILANKAGAYPSETLSGAPLLALPTNIILGWKGLPGANTLAYYLKTEIMAVKSFVILGLDCSAGVAKRPCAGIHQRQLRIVQSGKHRRLSRGGRSGRFETPVKLHLHERFCCAYCR